MHMRGRSSASDMQSVEDSEPRSSDSSVDTVYSSDNDLVKILDLVALTDLRAWISKQMQSWGSEGMSKPAEGQNQREGPPMAPIRMTTTTAREDNDNSNNSRKISSTRGVDIHRCLCLSDHASFVACIHDAAQVHMQSVDRDAGHHEIVILPAHDVQQL